MSTRHGSVGRHAILAFRKLKKGNHKFGAISGYRMISCIRKEKQKYHHHQKQRRKPKQTNTRWETTSWRYQWFFLWERWYASLSLSKHQMEEIGFLLKRWFSNLEMGSESLPQSQTHPKTGREKGDLSFQFPDVSTYFGLSLLSRSESGGGRQPVTAQERLRTFWKPVRHSTVCFSKHSW